MASSLALAWEQRTTPPAARDSVGDHSVPGSRAYPNASHPSRDRVAGSPRLDLGMPGERSTQRALAWPTVRGAFTEEGLALPTPAEAARYAAFVQMPGRPVVAHTAEVIHFPRDPTQGPRSA